MPLTCCCGKPIVNSVAIRTPPTVVSVEATGVTVTCGVMFSDHESSVAASAGRGVGDLELPGAVGDQACQVGERGRAGAVFGHEAPREWGRARGDGGLRRVVEDGVDEVLAGAPTAENSGIVSPFGATRTAVRPESSEDAMLSVTVMSAI